MIRRYIPKDLEELIRFHERYTSPLSLIFGFLLDTFILLRRVDLWQSNALLLFYLGVAAFGIILLNAVQAGRIKHPWILWLSPALPVIQQFAFGGLFSGFASLYGRSASYFGTWIFIGVLAVLMVGNERFRKLYMRFSFQIAVYFSALFLFFIFFLPILFDRIGDLIFVASGLVALGVIAGLLWTLSKVTPELERAERTRSARSVFTIWLVVNILYFTNLIPPLPLALKDAGVYHHVSRTGDGYELQGEPLRWYEKIFPVSSTFHKNLGNTAYVFTAVFAPTGLSTPITHEWQRKNDRGDWVTESTFSFTIRGGRDGGFRGYSLKSNPAPGKWRVNVLMPTGAFLGRVYFEVTSEVSADVLETTTH